MARVKRAMMTRKRSLRMGAYADKTNVAAIKRMIPYK